MLQAQPTAPHHHIRVRALSFLPMRFTAVPWVGNDSPTMFTLVHHKSGS